MHPDDAGIAKDTEVFGRLRLAEPKPIGDFPHGEGAFAQEFNHL